MRRVGERQMCEIRVPITYITFGTLQEVLDKLKTKGIAIRVASPKLVMEEAPESYKDVTQACLSYTVPLNCYDVSSHDIVFTQVVDTCHAAGISKKTVKLRPIAVIKG